LIQTRKGPPTRPSSPAHGTPRRRKANFEAGGLSRHIRKGEAFALWPAMYTGRLGVRTASEDRYQASAELEGLELDSCAAFDGSPSRCARARTGQARTPSLSTNRRDHHWHARTLTVMVNRTQNRPRDSTGTRTPSQPDSGYFGSLRLTRRSASHPAGLWPLPAGSLKMAWIQAGIPLFGEVQP
jgi:hypothetical protein